MPRRRRGGLVAQALAALALALALLPTRGAAQGVAPLIVGGVAVNASDTQYEFLGSMQARTGSGYTHFCGCSLVAARWVLTAAHCVTFGPPARIVFRAFDLRNTRSAVVRSVQRVVVHPRYAGRTNDVALLQLSSAISTIRPALLSDVAYDASQLERAGVALWTSGWGSQAEGGLTTSVLRTVQVPVVTVRACRLAYGATVDSSMICAGLAEGGKDSCQGDSGGPLFFQDASAAGASASVIATRLVGVVSFGTGCARAGFYGVYQRVSYHSSWIFDTLWELGPDEYPFGGSPPTMFPTEQPTASPTEPTPRPTREPSVRPTRAPSDAPSARPSRAPTPEPTRRPTRPTAAPTTPRPTTARPSRRPTALPTQKPTQPSTGRPSARPSVQPSPAPTAPTDVPTQAPTTSPTLSPTLSPTMSPTMSPTLSPTLSPTPSPTRAPSKSPTAPTGRPSAFPTAKPSTGRPTSKAPTTRAPSLAPTPKPSAPTTRAPTGRPTSKAPTGQPSAAPSTKGPTTQAPATQAPTTQAPTTRAPTKEPTTLAPTQAPTQAPTHAPTPEGQVGALRR